jgi:formiminoglutamase
MEIKIYSQIDIDEVVKKRAGEIRLGEKVRVLDNVFANDLEYNLSVNPCRYVLLGLPEDIGVRANFGRAGAYSAWHPALSTILNAQSNRFLVGEEVLVLGFVDFSKELDEVRDFNIQEKDALTRIRALVTEIDEFVAPIISLIVKSGKEPIIIGGGHNNAYPNIKGAVDGLMQSDKINESSINCINCDAHADLRPLEGRHSGNAFSYAMEEGLLNKYAIVGLHEIFNTQSVVESVFSNERISASFFEDIFIEGDDGFDNAVRDAIIFTGRGYIGLELDLDTIQNIPSSAKTSSGISTIQARRFVNKVASHSNVAYFHIAEAAPVLSHIKTDLKTGKLIAYLVTDYIKARNHWHHSKL